MTAVDRSPPVALDPAPQSNRVSVPQLLALTASAGLAGAFAPDAVMDFANYLGNVVAPSAPLAKAHLPADFKANAALGTVGVFNTLWFLGVILHRGKNPQHGAPLE